MKARLGADPLSWINSTKEEPAKKAKEENVKTEVIKPRRELTKSSQSGLPEGWTRATFIVKEDTLGKVKDLAFTERKDIKTVINEALEAHTHGKKIIKRGGDNA
jgi:hypothetical protein